MLKRIHRLPCVLNLFKINIDTCAGIFFRHRVTNSQATYVWKYMRLKDNMLSETELNFCLNSFKDRKSKGKNSEAQDLEDCLLALFFSVHVYVHVYACVCAHICACVCTDVDVSTCVCLFLHMFVCVYGSQRSASDICLPLLILLYLISFIFVCFMRCLSPCLESTIKTTLTSRCAGKIFLNPYGRLSHGSWESQLWSLWVWGRHSPQCKGSVSPLRPLLPNLQISVTTFEMLFINLFYLSCFRFLINKNITIHAQDCHSCGWNTNYVDYDLKKPKPWTLAAPTLAETHSV